MSILFTIHPKHIMHCVPTYTRAYTEEKQMNRKAREMSPASHEN